jgi:hypothetical protein
MQNQGKQVPGFKDYDPETKKTHKDLGTVRVNQTIAIFFEKSADCKPISGFNPDCGCTMPVNQTDRVMIQFTPLNIVDRTNKGVVVTYNDSTTERISFSAKVTS